MTLTYFPIAIRVQIPPTLKFIKVAYYGIAPISTYEHINYPYDDGSTRKQADEALFQSTSSFLLPSLSASYSPKERVRTSAFLLFSYLACCNRRKLSLSLGLSSQPNFRSMLERKRKRKEDTRACNWLEE